MHCLVDGAMYATGPAYFGKNYQVRTVFNEARDGLCDTVTGAPLYTGGGQSNLIQTRSFNSGSNNIK